VVSFYIVTTYKTALISVPFFWVLKSDNIYELIAEAQKGLKDDLEE
jgi:hypothetical protein